MGEEKQREIIREFVKFLKNEGVYCRYRENIMDNINNWSYVNGFKQKNNYIGFTYGIQIKLLHDSRGFERKFTMSLAEELINFAFTWDDTPQRHNFWAKLSEKWVGHIREKFKSLYFQYQN